jgi:hypothetical protein
MATASIAVAVGVSTAPTPQPVQAAAAKLPKICLGELKAAKNHGVDVTELSTSSVLRLDGRDIPLTDDSATWRVWDATDNTFNNRFHGMEWLIPWAVAGGDAVSAVLARDAALPDPGGMADRDTLQATGWTAGALRLRQNAINCLYAMTRDERLISVAERVATANLDTQRYRGRPEQAPHNLGMLANHALIESARVFDRSEWRDAAVRRMNADARSVFSSCGMTAEQSSAYHLTNVKVWERGLQRLRPADDTVAQPVFARIGEAALAVARLTRPDGVLEAIGDGNPSYVATWIAERSVLDDTVTAVPQPDTRLWCRSRGWAANRSSWDDTAIQYTLRFGPRLQAHGHADHGSMTWFAGGVPVLSDPGIYDKSRGERRQSASSMRAHSVLEPTQGSLKAPTRAVKRPEVDGWDRYKLVTRKDSVKRVRSIAVNLSEPVLRVHDVGSAPGNMPWLQHWQLAPGWVEVPAESPWTARAKHASGVYLYAACHSIHTMRMSVATREHYPKRRSIEPGLTLRCGAQGSRVTLDTILVVSPTDGRLTWDRRTGAYAVLPTDDLVTPEE